MSGTRSIPEFPSYIFHDDGRVYSKHSRKFLTPLRVPTGYLHVVLVENKIKVRVGLHRIITEAFHGEPPAHAVANHKNGLKSDNRAENLEWVSPSENVKHAYRNGLRVINDAHRARCANLGAAKRKTTPEQDETIRSMYTGKRGDIERIARRCQLTRDIIRRVLQEVRL